MIHSRGVTLVEGLVVVAILVLLAGIGTTSLVRTNEQQALQGAAATVRSVFHDARGRTLASRDGNQYGVHVEEESLALFIGSSYDAESASNEHIVLPPSVVVEHSFSGGGADVIFARLTGKASAVGTVTISLRADANASKTVTIQGTGLVEIGE